MRRFRRNYLLVYSVLVALLGALYFGRIALASNTDTNFSEAICLKDSRKNFPTFVVCSDSVPAWVERSWSNANHITFYSQLAVFAVPLSLFTDKNDIRVRAIFFLLALPHYLALGLVGSWGVERIRGGRSKRQPQG